MAEYRNRCTHEVSPEGAPGRETERTRARALVKVNEGIAKSGEGHESSDLAGNTNRE